MRGFEVVGELQRVALGVGGGELAAGVAGAGDQAAAERRRRASRGRAPRSPPCASASAIVGDVGDQQVLPDGQPDRAAAESVGDVGEAAHLLARSSGRPAARRRRRSGRAASAGGRRHGRACRRAAGAAGRGGSDAQRRADAPSRPRCEELRDAPASSTYFSRAFLRSVRSPCSMKTRTIAAATATHSSGSSSTPVSRAKSLWPVMPPSRRRK